MARPKKIEEWPKSFAAMLNYAFKKKRPEDRLAFYKLFLRDFLHKGSTAQATPQEIETALESDREKQFDENWAFHIRLWSEMSFEKWKRENIKRRMIKMATASWSNQARKKRKKK